MTQYERESQSPSPPNLVHEAVEELARRWRALVAFPVVAGVVAIAVSFFFHKEYEATAIFSPSQDLTANLPGSLTSIAAQFGVAVPSTGYSVYYFAQVVQSREVLRRVSLDTLHVDGRPYLVMDVLEASGDSPAERLEDAIRTLDKRLTVGSDDQSSLVTVTARAPTPALATALAQSVVSSLNEVTRASLQTGGSYERRFAAAQADSARDALHEGEDRLRDFYLANRNFQSSPTLQVQEARLKRQIQIQQELYLALTSQAEAAKLREVRNTPAISMVQPPRASEKKVFPRRFVWALFAMIGALMCAAGWVYVLAPIVPERYKGREGSLWNRIAA